MATPIPYFEISSKLEIKMLDSGDLERVYEIEKLCFPNPWPKRIFEMELETPRSTNMVTMLDGVVCGYIISWKIQDEIHILNIAVHPDFRRLGVGRFLLGNCLDFFSGQGAVLALLEVRDSNLPAQNLYSKFGFKQIGIRKNYYTDNGEDAIVMLKKFDGNNG